MKQKKRNILAVLLSLLLILLAGWSIASAAGGTPASSLEIKVGYFGGPYYTKATFSSSEMDAMADVRQAYTFIDNMPSVCVDYAKGITLTDLLSRAGIDANSVQRFDFFTMDSGGSKYVGMTREKLLDAERYYYPQLPYHYTQAEGVEEGADADKEQVPAMIAVSDNWLRYQPGDPELVEDFSNQSSQYRYRLLFGQTVPSDSAAYESAMWIHSINVMLGGSPSLTVKKDDYKDMEVGSSFRMEINVDADDSIREFIEKDIVWSSSDENIAIVDENGTVTIKKEGKVTITATYTMKNEDGSKKEIKAEAQVSGSQQGSDKTKTPSQQGSGDDSGKGSGGSGSDSADNQGSGKNSVVLGDRKVTADAKALQKKLEKNAAGKDGSARQKWRVYEMSETAEEMPKLEEDETSEGALAGMITGTLFLIGIAGRALLFFKQL